MKKIKKQDQKIIQKKIDGLLTATEEEYFDKLISTCPEAKDLYRQLAILHHALEYNSGHIQKVNLTDEIMQSTKDKKPANGTPGFISVDFLSRNRRQVLAYAAIFIFGIMLGGFATFLGSTSAVIKDTGQFKGTMAKSESNKYSYIDGGTSIKIQDFESGSTRMHLICIETIDSIHCTFQSENGELLTSNINLLHSDGEFRIKPQGRQDLSCVCTGENVFLVNNLNGLNTDSIRFYRKNVLIYDYKTE
jgi:hypothetical protein